MNPDSTHPAAYTRRRFLHQGLTLASASLTIPAFLQRSAFGLPVPEAGCEAIPGVPQDHILVVVQLGGGNDGLNTVVPFANDTYYRVRPGLSIPKGNVLTLGKGEDVGFHPAMRELKDLFDDGQVCLMQGVGYPNPNRSHFKSMDIWHTADLSGTGTGWLGRYFDNECCGAPASGQGGQGAGARPQPEPMAGVSIGREAPLAMEGRIGKPISFENTDLFRWMGSDVHPSLVKPYDDINRAGLIANADPESNAGFLMRTALDAQVSSEQIRRAVEQRALVQYPGSDLARQLQMIASMIRAGLKTRVYYATISGFDTHSGQGGEQGRHAQLVGQVSGALRAFYRDLKEQGNDGRVLTMTFSEFGRRVAQNASGGTDHGTAAPLFLVGPMVNAGVRSDHPSLIDLDDGDLKYSVDFRSVYAGILEQWLGADSKKILDGTYKAAPVLKRTT